MDKDRIDMALEMDLIAEKDICIIVAETEGTIRRAILLVIEVTDPEMGITQQIIGIVIGLIIEGKISTKIMAKGIESVSREHDRSRPRYRSISGDNSGNRYRNNQSKE